MTYEEFKPIIASLPKQSRWLIYGTALVNARSPKKAFVIVGSDFPDLFSKVDSTTEWEINKGKDCITKIMKKGATVFEATRLF